MYYVIYYVILPGIAHVTSLVYLLELSPTLYRGQVLIANQLVKPLGNTVSGLVNVTIGKLSSTTDWRLVAYTSHKNKWNS